jgi:hypothetical protein
MILAEFGTGQVLWSMLWFTLFFMWIWTVVIVFSDIFRSEDLSGWGKALWSLFVIFMPFLGVFVYLIARGSKMRERQMAQSAYAEQEYREYIRDAAGSSSPATEVAKLASLHEQGVLDDAEFQQAKARALA